TSSSMTTWLVSWGPPCTTRWATMSGSASNRSSAAAMASGPAGSSTRSTSSGSWPGVASYAAHFRVGEPALTQRIRHDATRAPGNSIGPDPVADLGYVLEVLVDVQAMGRELRVTVVQERLGAVGTAARPPHRLLGEVEPAHVVQHHHVERRGRGALFE